MSTLREEVVRFRNECNTDVTNGGSHQDYPHWVVHVLDRILAAHPEPEPGAELRDQLAKLTCEGCRAGMPIINGRHHSTLCTPALCTNNYCGMGACESKADSILELFSSAIDAERALCDRLNSDLVLAASTVEAWAVDYAGLVHVHKDVILKIVNAGVAAYDKSRGK